MKLLYQTLLLLFLMSSCSSLIDGKHLHEKIFKSKDITVKWYKVSAITSEHDFIDLERWGWTKTIMKVSSGGIYDIIFKDDTVTIQTRKDIIVFDLMAQTLNCHIKLDTSITMCQYMKKHVPENAQYYCNEAVSDSSIKK